MPSLLSLLFPLSVAALGTIDCSKMLADKHNFDLSALDGPHSVMHSVDQPPSMLNTTYTINICRPLVPDSGVKKEERCPGPTRVCAIERLINPIEDTTTISRVIPIAGDLQNFPGGTLLDASYTRLRTAPSPADQEREGIRVELHGGSYKGRKQRAVVEFLCDPDVTGTEEEEESVLDVYRRAEDGGEGKGNGTTTRGTKPLVFKKYGPEGAKGEVDVLTLEWRTMYACENVDGGGGQKASWGFFTWFIIIAFMSIATYLIFGSWLNYNRYGARGWDLLPHGDTIRDVPYLIKDWSRRVFNTVQDSGSRGGYAAV
ncbi:hypothetical protein V495_01640 [Pseudogymnoascus sp. VKM F-4514 (FW-929)]|nr:hypothetical protein V495_01640 [Pseudogymnoascus sp. VKM F-4514 (FW-929)]KFY65588.1 hypothetical protein V497_01361 [Pseudogymnoascus sp. VKM F-4516 (FW-969)]